MPSIALVTTAEARPLDDDLGPLTRALEAQGAAVAWCNWEDPAIDWSAYDLAVLRSPWNYTQRYAEFCAWAARAAEATRLLNPLQVIQWNTDKHYLADLERVGIPIVPSVFVVPGTDPGVAFDAILTRWPEAMDLVAKPTIGAGSRGAGRFQRHDRALAVEHIRGLLTAGHTVLAQPYLDRVDDSGETSLIYLGGEFSHAIRKGALLRRNEGPTRALFAAEHIMPREPTTAERACADRVIGSLPYGRDLAYARVDLLAAADGSPRLLELELAEPSLFFDHGPGSAERFAQVLLRRL